MPGSRKSRATSRFCPLVVIVTALTAAMVNGGATPACIGAVDALLEPWDRPDAPGAVVGIFEEGEILYAKGHGIANLDYGIPLSQRTVLRTGSISKQFIAMGIALLAEQGKLNVSDDIRKYLPEMPDYGVPITLAHLLHHTSGIREYLALVSLIGKPEGSGYVYTPEELLSLLARQKALEFSPGEKFSYSNSGYFLLAEIISRTSGTRTRRFLEEHIFQPLGMDATRLHDDPDAVIRNRGVGYSSTGDGGYRLDILRLKVVGDLGVVTSVEDFFKWDQNFYDNKLGNASPELIETVLTPGTLNNGERLDYAYGLIIGRYRGLRTISHGGSVVGYVSHYLRFPEQRFSVVVLSNLRSFSPGPMARRIADLCLADRFTEPRAPGTEDVAPEGPPATRPLSDSEIAMYAGDYYSEELDVVYRLRKRDGNLNLTINALSGSVQARSADHLRWKAGGADFLFSRDPGGKIDGFFLRSEAVHGLRFVRLGSE